jgi:hypothetical protein
MNNQWKYYNGVFLWKYATIKRIDDKTYKTYYNGEYVGTIKYDPRTDTYNSEITLSKAIKTLVVGL